MAAILRDSVAVVAVVVVRTRPRAIPLVMIIMRKFIDGFPFLSHTEYGVPLGGPWGRRSLAKKANEAKITVFMKNSDLGIRRGTFKSLRAV